MSNFTRKLQSRPGAEPHLIESESHEYVMARTASGKPVNRKPHATASVIENTRELEFTASQSTANAFASAGSGFDIRIPAGSGHIITGHVLRLGITNNTGAACTLIPADLLIDRIEVWGNNANLLVQTLYGDAMWADNDLMSKEQWSLNAAVSNTTNAWGAGASIANGAQVTYYLPFSSALSVGGVFLGGLKGDLFIRVFFRTGSATICEAGAAPTLSSLSCILQTRELSPSKLAKMQRAYASGVFDHPYLSQINQSVSQTFNASTQYDQVLSGVTGMVSHAWIMLRASTLAAGLRTFASTIDSYNLLDESGNSITGLSIIPAAYGRYVKAAEWFPGDMGISLPILSWSHNQHPTLSMETGANYGFHAYDSKEILRLTTSAAHANAVYELRMIAYIYRLLRVNAGQLEVYSS